QAEAIRRFRLHLPDTKPPHGSIGKTLGSNPNSNNSCRIGDEPLRLPRLTIAILQFALGRLRLVQSKGDGDGPLAGRGGLSKSVWWGTCRAHGIDGVWRRVQGRKRCRGSADAKTSAHDDDHS